MLKMRYYSPDGEGSGGSGDQTTQTTGQTTQTTGNDDAARAADFQSQLTSFKGDALRYAEKLHDRVYGLRQRAQAAEAQIPQDGMEVVTVADHNALKAYRELGTAAEISEQKDALIKLQKYQMVGDAAQVAGMNPKVLSTLLPGEVKLEIGEATDAEGQAKQAVYLIEEGKEKTLLDVYAADNWKDFLPALKAEGEPPTGQQWIQQQGSTGGDANGMSKVLATRLDAIEKAKAEKSRF